MLEKNGAKIVAFPETWVPGYPWFIWLDAPAWGLQFIPEYAQNSIRADGPEMERVKQAAKASSIYVSLGYSEKHGGSQYIAILRPTPSKTHPAEYSQNNPTRFWAGNSLFRLSP